MKKLYFTLCLLMVAIMSYAQVTIDGVRYSDYGIGYANATIVDKNLTNIVVLPKVTIDNEEKQVMWIDKANYEDVYPNARTISVPMQADFRVNYFANRFLPALEEWKSSDNSQSSTQQVYEKCLYRNQYGTSYIMIPAKLKGELRLPEDALRVNINDEDYEQAYDGITSLYIGKAMNELWLLESKRFPALTAITVNPENTSLSTDAQHSMLIDQNKSVAFFCQGHTYFNIPEGVRSVGLYDVLKGVTKITLPSTLEEFYYYQDMFPDLERFEMPTANQQFRVYDGILFRGDGTLYCPLMATSVNLKEGGYKGTDCTLSNMPKLQSVVTNDELEDIDLTNLPALHSLTIGKNLRSMAYNGTFNITDFIIDSENTHFTKEASGVIRINGDYYNRYYFPANVTSYCIPKDVDINGAEFMRWPNLKNLTMEEREKDTEYGATNYSVKDNVVYKEQYGTLWAIDVAGGVTDLKLRKETYNLESDYYGKTYFYQMPNLKTITVEDGAQYLKVVDNTLCKKNYLWGTRGENEWDPYELVTILNVPSEAEELTLFATTPAELAQSYTFMGFKIGTFAYEKNSHLKKLSFGPDVSGTEQCAFQECPNLEEVNITPECTFSLGHMTFYNCYKLNNITFSDNVLVENNSAFANTAWRNKQKGDMLYAGKSLYYVSENVENIDIPDGTICVADGALDRAKNAKEMTIPEGLFYWYDRTFDAPKNIEKLTIKTHKFNKIPYDAFNGYTGLKTVVATSTNPIYFDDEFEYRLFPNDLSNVELIVPEDYDEVDEKTGETYHVSPKARYANSTVWSRFGKIVATGIEEVNAPAVADTYFYLLGHTLSIGTGKAWYIYTANGQVVRNGRGKAQVSLPSGLYLLKMAGKTVKLAVK